MKPTVAMVTRWGVACGMDNYARELVTSAADRIEVRIHANRETIPASSYGMRVVRDWDAESDEIDELTSNLLAESPDVIHVQFNWRFIRLSALSRLIDFAAQHSIPMLLQLHATFDDALEGSLASIADKLRRVELIIVHGRADADRLSTWGVTDNVRKWRLGERPWPSSDSQEVRECIGLGERRPIIATFGFFQRRKGFLQLAQAMGRLREVYPEVLLLASSALHPRGFDSSYYLECRDEVYRVQHNVALITRYLREDIVMTLLQASDVIVLPYTDTPEGTSAAAKFCAAARRPLIVSNEALFDDYREASITLDAVEPGAIAAAIERVVSDRDLADSLAAAAGRHADSLSWDTVGAEYVQMIQALAVQG